VTPFLTNLGASIKSFIEELTVTPSERDKDNEIIMRSGLRTYLTPIIIKGENPLFVKKN
jgi:hypothetical protein